MAQRIEVGAVTFLSTDRVPFTTRPVSQHYVINRVNIDRTDESELSS